MRFISGLKKFIRKWKISNEHILQDPAVFIQSPNMGGSLLENENPLFIILHYTATYDAAEAITILCDPKREVSAHLVVDREGFVTQLVPFDRIAWHAGVSEWQGIKSLNSCSIGIEIVNAGKLEKRDSEYFSWDNKRIPSHEVYAEEADDEKTYWHSYTDVQLTAVRELIACISQHYKVKEVLRHSDISPGRKIDPGPALPTDFFRKDSV